MKATEHSSSPAALFRSFSSLLQSDGRRGRVSLDDDFQLDNVGSEYHETEPRLLTDKDVFYICIILFLVGVLVAQHV